ncbi:2-succinyl-5-enolpyruvyl-6-hydroxy-3-cyclohexene-1-carboxylic-acid synthase [Maribacter sp. X9]|uniref:2-succinyl-5-enolpyruvyl-6-hydroxy-3- cyclohexene-1-carboxylic-acid synthase n=1 Tax=Maribacter sp. X9 TaxID=3402159 RepID=UPI003AF3E031
MKYSSIPTVQAIVKHCQAHDIGNIVISPGSRNAPLTIAFTENPFFSCYSIVDERCAAFFALGMAQQLHKPVVVICTSGSALLNYYPAVAEAYYSEIPLVVISADRPCYKIGIGDGQTIKQQNVYEQQIGYSANLRQDVSHATEKVLQYRPEWITADTVEEVQRQVQSHNDRELNKALRLAFNSQLPVHINVPLEEPLYNTLSESKIEPQIELISAKKEYKLDLEPQRDIWNKAKRKMILVGVSAPNRVEEQFLKNLANDPSVLVFTETTSNLNHPNFFNSIDSIIAPIEMHENRQEQFEALQPEILVTFGGLIVSKKIKAFLRNYTPKHHWHIGGERANDTFFCLELHFKLPVDRFFDEMYYTNSSVESSYFNKWNQVKKNYLLKRTTYLQQIPFSDFSVFDKILKGIPQGYLVQLANSSTVRYAQLFEMDRTLKVFCNRGTSGIDGSSSTAIGASLISEKPTLLLTGDLSFFYDSNALWNNYMRKDFRIIVVNNSGGGIFRILPGKEDSENFKTFFETRHSLTAEQLCLMHNMEYKSANSAESVQNELNSFYNISSRPTLLEIFTPTIMNDKILTDYFRFIS